MDYYRIASPGMLAALAGSLGLSLYRKHDTTLILKRALENSLVVGLPLHFVASQFVPVASPIYYLIVAGGVFFVWTNPIAKPFTDKLDAMQASLVNLLV